jgi:hypothetical protein
MINIADVELINAGSKQQRYPYNYQVDLFLEIDNALIQNTGGGVQESLLMPITTSILTNQRLTLICM